MNNPLDNFTVERLEDLIEYENFGSLSMVQLSDLSKIALAAKQAKPTAWRVGGYLSNDKKWAERASEEENYLLEPLYDHPLITGIDQDHYDPELEPGLYLAEIMTKGGAACINGKFTMPTTPQLPDGWVLVPKEPTEDMVIQGSESSPEDDDEDFEAMSGCQQAACCAELCWAAMIAAAPKPE